MKTLTEKRFFEWHEDDKSVTLRNRGGSYGGGAKSSLSTLPRQSRSIVCHGLQMGTTRTSNAREVDSMREVIGIDSYNLSVTGDVGRTMATACGGLNEHIPIVVIGVDFYNQCITGGVSKTLNAVKSDSDHTPCILIKERK